MISALELKNIGYTYNGHEEILKDINLSLDAGQALGILGPNGGGKSTLLKLIVGLLEVQAGEILYFGSKRIPRKEISYLPQFSSFNTTLPIRIMDLIQFSGLSSVAKMSFEEACEWSGIRKDPKTIISQLSGGERQRVLLAKAIMTHPKILVLDEPTQGLDTKGQDQLLELIQKVKEQFNTAIVMVDHNINQTIKHCDQILCLNRTFHSHQKRDLLNKNLLEETYHCEFEHLLIHEKGIDHLDHKHHECKEHSPNHQHDEGEK